jgi:hypothetical protein
MSAAGGMRTSAIAIGHEKTTGENTPMGRLAY